MSQPAPIRFDIILADGFVLTELAGVVDVLRLANRTSVRPVFEWQYRSLAGGVVQSSSAASVVTEPLEARPDVDYAVVLGNADADHPALHLGAQIRAYTLRETQVVLLAEAASCYIADQGARESPHTTHWENRTVLQEQRGLYETGAALVSQTGLVITCAGMGATYDVTLSIVEKSLSFAAMQTVADILLHERVRHHNTLQPFAGRTTRVTGDTDVDRSIAKMQNHIEYPLTIAEISESLDVSLRSLERKFHRHLGTTPNGYYRQIRLTKANNLLLNTRLPIQEIGLACGFPNGFSSIYKSVFGLSPKEARSGGRL